MNKENGLKELAAYEGMTEMELLEDATYDSVVPGICLDCGYSCGVEPDSSEGYCETCEKNSVQSCLVLAGII